MSYSGMKYATAGLGIEAQVDKAALNTGAPSNGTTATKEPRPVRVLQQLLQGRGFDPGPIDGIWGPRTRTALYSAIGEVSFTVSGDKRQVWLLVPDWARIQQLSIRGGGGPGRIPRPVPGPSTDEADGSASIVGDAPNYLPWVLGAGGLLAVGGWYMWRGKKMKRNRRRRRRRSSRR